MNREDRKFARMTAAWLSGRPFPFSARSRQSLRTVEVIDDPGNPAGTSGFGEQLHSGEVISASPEPAAIVIDDDSIFLRVPPATTSIE